MKLIKMTCSNCGALLELDLDNMQAYCPYCGQKLLFDLEHMEEVFSAKEKTKQEQEKTRRLKMDYEYKDKESRRSYAALIGVFLFAIIVGLASCIGSIISDNAHKKKNEAQVSISSEELNKSKYYEVVRALESAGFTDIELVPDKDLLIGLLSKDGDMEHISINGDSEFSADDWFPKDAHVVITYHTFKKK